jgi:hypothetical protein
MRDDSFPEETNQSRQQNTRTDYQGPAP